MPKDTNMHDENQEKRPQINLKSIEGSENKFWESYYEIWDRVEKKKSVPYKFVVDMFACLQMAEDEELIELRKQAMLLTDQVYEKMKNSFADFKIEITGISRPAEFSNYYWGTDESIPKEYRNHLDIIHIEYIEYIEYIEQSEQSEQSDIMNHKVTYTLKPLLFKVAFDLCKKFNFLPENQKTKQIISQNAYMFFEEHLKDISDRKKRKNEKENKPSDYMKIAISGLFDAYYRNEVLKSPNDRIQDYNHGYSYYIKQLKKFRNKKSTK